MRARTITLLIALLALAPLQQSAHATGNAIACQLIGTVQLKAPTDLQHATQGSGQFETATSSLTCTGAVTGSGQLTSAQDTFSFCIRGGIASSTNPACKKPQAADALGLDPAYGVLDAARPGLVAYFLGGPVTASGFEIGSQCTFSFNGYAVAANATIHITSFACAGLPVMTGEATATSIPVADIPCGSSMCFQQVVFLGSIEVHD